MSFEPNGILTLTTDFGSRDGYVGAMKGAVLSIQRNEVHAHSGGGFDDGL